MATAEAETSQDQRGPPGGLVYDGFISYSHAADDLLAPRLQAGLQRFAKPRWKRRALRIFRDESSLSANPHLWSSIIDALDQSEWFILLSSPDAAESPWVNDEVEYWLEHKDADRIIPVLTDGQFGWAGEELGRALRYPRFRALAWPKFHGPGPTAGQMGPSASWPRQYGHQSPPLKTSSVADSR